jgi:hypothetical protein
VYVLLLLGALLRPVESQLDQERDLTCLATRKSVPGPIKVVGRKFETQVEQTPPRVAVQREPRLSQSTGKWLLRAGWRHVQAIPVIAGGAYLVLAGGRALQESGDKAQGSLVYAFAASPTLMGQWDPHVNLSRFSRGASHTTHFTVGEKSPSLTMSAKSSTMYAHYRMHSWKSAISLWWMVCAFQPWARF